MCGENGLDLKVVNIPIEEPPFTLTRESFIPR